MTATRARSRVVVGAAILALAVTGCRSAEKKPETGAGGIKTGPGVTKEPCPDSTNKDRGCIYLGTISDLTEGPFKALAVPITDAQKAFWKRVNDSGGIGGKYDVNVTKFVKDNKYNPQVHNQVYQEIKGQVLAIAQTLGSPTTAAIIADLKAQKIVAAPASWTSAWAFEDVIMESGANYCIESMNSVDYAVEELAVKSVLAVHYPGDYGADAAAGAKVAAEKHGLTFKAVETAPGPDNQAGAIAAVTGEKPDLVILTTNPTDGATIVGQAAGRGFKGKFIGTSPTWNPGLLKSPAAPAIKALYLTSVPWAPFGSDTPGHKAMRDALGSGVQPNDGYTSGWLWSYPLKAALQQAVADNDLSREGLLAAVKKLKSVDYEGMLPQGAGNYADDPNTATFRQTGIYKPDDAAPTGVSEVKGLFTGPTATDYKLDGPCFLK
jgi:ABC-type branched-subunit amino acid transport system substrate-binding protein